MPDPEYLVYGANATAVAAGPSRAAMPWLDCFILDADGAAIDAYVDRVLNGISGGAVTYRSLSHNVMLTVGSMVAGRSLTPPYTTMGTLDELQLGFWLFVARVHQRSSWPRLTVMDRVLTYVPYMLVDNPLSLTIGREVNGFAKSWGYFDIDRPSRYGIDAYGGNFGDDETAGRRPFVSITAAGPTDEDHVEWSDLGELLTWFRPNLSVAVPGLGLADDLWDLIRDGESWGLFLRQLRSTEDNLKASHQEVAENPIKAAGLHGQLLPHAFDVTIERLDSSPVAAELGVASQQVGFGLELTLELELGEGETLWSSGAS